MITDEQKRKYVESGGSICPFCGSTLIEGISSVETERSGANQDVQCNYCEREWTDLYTLTGIEPLDIE